MYTKTIPNATFKYLLFNTIGKKPDIPEYCVIYLYI